MLPSAHIATSRVTEQLRPHGEATIGRGSLAMPNNMVGMHCNRGTRPANDRLKRPHMLQWNNGGGLLVDLYVGLGQHPLTAEVIRALCLLPQQ